MAWGKKLLLSLSVFAIMLLKVIESLWDVMSHPNFSITLFIRQYIHNQYRQYKQSVTPNGASYCQENYTHELEIKKFHTASWKNLSYGGGLGPSKNKTISRLKLLHFEKKVVTFQEKVEIKFLD